MHRETEELWREAISEPVGSGNKLEGQGSQSESTKGSLTSPQDSGLVDLGSTLNKFPGTADGPIGDHTEWVARRQGCSHPVLPGSQSSYHRKSEPALYPLGTLRPLLDTQA